MQWAEQYFINLINIPPNKNIARGYIEIYVDKREGVGRICLR
jgi:hypothetical protein